MTPSWPSLMNSCAGRPAVVIGKGPTLDAWLAAGCPQPEGAVRIGVNQVAEVVHEVPFSVSGDGQMDHYFHLPTQWLRGVPYLWADTLVTDCPRADWTFVQEKRPGEGWIKERLRLSREQIAETGCLWYATSSAHPALHFAWYLGCTSVLLVGMDGRGGRAQSLAVSMDRDPPSDEVYADMLRHTHEAADLLFGRRWSHWAPFFTN